MRVLFGLKVKHGVPYLNWLKDTLIYTRSIYRTVHVSQVKGVERQLKSLERSIKKQARKLLRKI